MNVANYTVTLLVVSHENNVRPSDTPAKNETRRCSGHRRVSFSQL